MARGFARLSSLCVSSCVSFYFSCTFHVFLVPTTPWLLVLELVLFISELCHLERQIQGQVTHVSLLFCYLRGWDNQRPAAALHQRYNHHFSIVNQLHHYFHTSQLFELLGLHNFTPRLFINLKKWQFSSILLKNLNNYCITTGCMLLQSEAEPGLCVYGFCITISFSYWDLNRLLVYILDKKEN